MNEPSSRTPEGLPHHCEICGTSFRLNISLTGDVCCPNCNALVWTVDEERVAPQSITSQASRSHIKEIRLRPRTIETEFDQKAKRAAVSLKQHKEVRVSVLFAGRSAENKEEGKAILERFIASLVPEHAKIKTPAGIDGRRIICTLTPTSSKDGG